MSRLKFLLHIIKHGSFFNKPVNFRRHQHQILESLRGHSTPRTTLYSSARDWFAETRLLGPIIENIAYWKGVDQQHKNFFCVDSLKLIYLRILKSASTSVLRELLPLIDERLKSKELTDDQIDQLAAASVTHKLIDERLNYSMFTIVRNPFHRLVSVYRDLFNIQNQEFVYRNYLFGILKQDMSFPEFVKTLTLIPRKLLAPHFVSQDNIISASGEMSQLKIFRLEKDQELLKNFLCVYHITLGHSNKAPDYDYRSYYNRGTAELALTLYQDDVRAFGYDDEYEQLLRFVMNQT